MSNSPYQKLSTESCRTVSHFFRKRPEAEYCYLFHDGRVEERVEVYGSLQGQLLSMATVGIPMLIYRRGFSRWCSK